MSEETNRQDTNWQHEVTNQLYRIESEQVSQREEQKLQGERIFKIHGDVSGLKARSAVFGVVGGFFAAVLAKISLGGH